VRAQFAAMGAPLYGDTAYALQRGITLDSAATDLDDSDAWLHAANSAFHAIEVASAADAAAAAVLRDDVESVKTLTQPRTLAGFLTARRLERLKSNKASSLSDDNSQLEAHDDATIALQAARIAFAGRDVHCRLPWWRRKVCR